MAVASSSIPMLGSAGVCVCPSQAGRRVGAGWDALMNMCCEWVDVPWGILINPGSPFHCPVKES